MCDVATNSHSSLPALIAVAAATGDFMLTSPARRASSAVAPNSLVAPTNNLPGPSGATYGEPNIRALHQIPLKLNLSTCKMSFEWATIGP